jgi:hypothetical protein
MYCQQCGAEVGEAKFCRKCGAPSGTAPLSLQQTVPASPPDYEKGFKKLFMGLAFLTIAIFPIFTSGTFWWWMLFPAVPLLAAGIGEFMRTRHAKALPTARAASLTAVNGQTVSAPQNELPRARDTAELLPQPSSVTEGTTRIMDKGGASSE